MPRVFIIFNLLMILGVFTASASERTVIADFDNGRRSTGLGEDFGTWDKDINDSTQGCRMSFSKDDALGEKSGKSLQLDYDVDSPNPAYNGFWLRISNAKVAGFDTLSFYVKGDAEEGFTSKIKIELKDKKHGKSIFFVENINSEWQKISLTLDERSFADKQSKPFEEFVIVFDDTNSFPKTGRIFIDQIEFSKS